MLAANEAVAQFLVDKGLYLMRRIHENPSPAKLSELKDLLNDLGYKSKNLGSRFELKRVIEESRDTPESQAVHFAILRAMPKAIYSPRELGHRHTNAIVGSKLRRNQERRREGDERG